MNSWLPLKFVLVVSPITHDINKSYYSLRLIFINYSSIIRLWFNIKFHPFFRFSFMASTCASHMFNYMGHFSRGLSLAPFFILNVSFCWEKTLCSAFIWLNLRFVHAVILWMYYCFCYLLRKSGFTDNLNFLMDYIWCSFYGLFLFLILCYMKSYCLLIHSSYTMSMKFCILVYWDMFTLGFCYYLTHLLASYSPLHSLCEIPTENPFIYCCIRELYYTCGWICLCSRTSLILSQCFCLYLVLIHNLWICLLLIS